MPKGLDSLLHRYLLNTEEYYSARKKNETMNSAGKWMDLEKIILREVIQAQTDECPAFSFTGGFSLQIFESEYIPCSNYSNQESKMDHCLCRSVGSDREEIEGYKQSDKGSGKRGLFLGRGKEIG